MLPINNNEFQIDLTDSAFKQIQLILENDFTLEGHQFRLKIGGKGCDGFTYDTGFSTKIDDDIELIFKQNDESISILLDDFTGFYCKEGLLDFLFDKPAVLCSD